MRDGQSQGLCDTTQTERFAFRGCKCGTYAGNLGPCKSYEAGGSGNCVYCEHSLVCHEAVIAMPQPETPR